MSASARPQEQHTVGVPDGAGPRDAGSPGHAPLLPPCARGWFLATAILLAVTAAAALAGAVLSWAVGGGTLTAAAWVGAAMVSVLVAVGLWRAARDVTT